MAVIYSSNTARQSGVSGRERVIGGRPASCPSILLRLWRGAPRFRPCRARVESCVQLAALPTDVAGAEEWSLRGAGLSSFWSSP